jgi:hypothetical protein
MMTPEQAQRLELITAFVDDAEGAALTADTLAQSSLMHSSMDPELCGHISIARQHLQMAQRMLTQQAKEVAHE